MNKIVLALGSNIGDRNSFLDKAIILLKKKIDIKKVSSWLENKAVGGPAGQGDFLNGALLGVTQLDPYELLGFVKKIEVTLGRDLTAQRWSERVIDIDIIFYNDEIIESEELNIPHNLMHKRDFVLIPLSEICPEYKHPHIGVSVKELLKELI